MSSFLLFLLFAENVRMLILWLVIHESVNSWSEHDYTRAWFGWANGLFGELIVKVAEEDEKAGRKPGWLGESYQ